MAVGGAIMVIITVDFGCWAVVRVRALRRIMSVVVMERIWVGGSIFETLVRWSMMMISYVM